MSFFQSDIIHQSAMELIHSEDREDFKNQLNWRSQLADKADMTLQEVLLPGKNMDKYSVLTIQPQAWYRSSV